MELGCSPKVVLPFQVLADSMETQMCFFALYPQCVPVRLQVIAFMCAFALLKACLKMLHCRMRAYYSVMSNSSL